MNIKYNFESETISGIMGFETLDDLRKAIKEEMDTKDHETDYKTISIATILLAFSSTKLESMITGVMFTVHSLIDETVKDPSSLVKYLLKLDEKTLKSLVTSIMEFTVFEILRRNNTDELKTKSIDELVELLKQK